MFHQNHGRDLQWVWKMIAHFSVHIIHYMHIDPPALLSAHLLRSYIACPTMGLDCKQCSRHIRISPSAMCHVSNLSCSREAFEGSPLQSDCATMTAESRQRVVRAMLESFWPSTLHNQLLYHVAPSTCVVLGVRSPLLRFVYIVSLKAQRSHNEDLHRQNSATPGLHKFHSGTDFFLAIRQVLVSSGLFSFLSLLILMDSNAELNGV